MAMYSSVQVASQPTQCQVMADKLDEYILWN